jgi:hypothetical protein
VSDDQVCTAIIAIRPSLCGEVVQFREKQLERFAARLGYTVLAIIDTDVIPDLWMPLTKWHPDAVITLAETHIQLAEVTRVCEVITSIPEAMHYRDGYELLGDTQRPLPDGTLPQRIPGASGLAPHPGAPPRAATTADWTRLVPAILGVLRARDESARAT